MQSRFDDTNSSSAGRSRRSMLATMRNFRSFRSQRAIGARKASAMTQDTDRLSASLSSAAGSDLSDTPVGEQSGKVGGPSGCLECRCLLFLHGLRGGRIHNVLCCVCNSVCAQDRVMEGSSFGPLPDSSDQTTSFAWAIMRAADTLVVAAMEFRGYAMSSSFQVLATQLAMHPALGLFFHG